MEAMSREPNIGDIEFPDLVFSQADRLIQEFAGDEFKKKNAIERSELVNQALFDLIEAEPATSFLLRQVTHFLAQITIHEILDGVYNLTAFERWLNQLSGLNYEENRRLRGKIAGKYIPRDEYAGIFPISQNKVHPGTHTVTAHTPPDLDSLTGSFIGWLDAFACRVGTTLTVWNVPLGKPGAVASRMFTKIYSDEIFYRVAKQKSLISHVAMDILTQDRLTKARGDVNIRDLNHNRHSDHIIYVDREGFFLGDWRVSDVDAIAQVQRLLNMFMHAYEKEMIFSLTKFFMTPHFQKSACEELIHNLLGKTIPEFSMQAYKLTDKKTHELDTYLKKVLGVPGGYLTPINIFFDRMDDLAGSTFQQYGNELKKLSDPEYYDNDQKADFEKEEIFTIIHNAYHLLIESTKTLRCYLDRLDVAMAIKHEVLGFKRTTVGTKAEIHEIKSKTNDYRHMTVVFNDKQGRQVPVGVVHRDDLDAPVQGTVSFRDFCNYDEIKLHDYLEVISAIDHHKSTISSKTAMVLTVADVQSCNVITAEKAFEINDRFSSRGQSLVSIDAQVKEIQSKGDLDQSDLRLLEKLFRKKRAIANVAHTPFFVSPDRELQEYILCLNAIIDDTDLLNKCCWRDLIVTTELINRIKSLQLKKEVEIIDFNDVNKDRRELKKCIREVLKNKELYSFYKSIYDHRENVVDQLINEVLPKSDTRFFEDRKIQNQSCAISQFKLFPGNWKSLQKNRNNILEKWMSISLQVRRKVSEVDFFLHMMSTIPGADEAYRGIANQTGTDDEFWLSGLPEADESVSRMRQFFINLRKSSIHQNINLRCHIEGTAGPRIEIFTNILNDTLGEGNYPFVENKALSLPVIIFRFAQGSLNSRKAHITPLLPK
jgi:hypothetical protein